MATTTTHYGFDIPQSTDLVKDGATAIATLGQDIDTAMNTALGTKKSGLVLLNTTNFTAVATQALPASSFTSTYRNYRVVWRHTQNTSNGVITLRMRAAGTNATGADYSAFGLYSGFSAGPTRINTTGATNWTITTVNSGNIGVIIFDITGPQVANQTMGFLNGFSTSGGDLISLVVQHGQSISYDSIDFISSVGTMTGQVSVYGYNE
jgi:hypothetical protein